MSSLKQTGDDDYEIGHSSLVDDEASTLPEPDTKEGANFWGYMTGIWSTIERNMNNLYTYVFAQNDVFDENDLSINIVRTPNRTEGWEWEIMQESVGNFICKSRKEAELLAIEAAFKLLNEKL